MAFWGRRGLWTRPTEGEGTESLAGWLLGVLVAALFHNGWRVVVELAGEAGDTAGSAPLAGSLAGGCGIRAGPPAAARRRGSVVLVLRGLAGVTGTGVPLGFLLAGRDPRAGTAVVRFSRPCRGRSVWKVKVVPESRGRRGPSWGRYVSACPHCLLRWVQ